MFKREILNALKNEKLKENLWKATRHTLEQRERVLKNIFNWEILREKANLIRKYSIENLWEKTKEKIEERGGKFYFAKSEGEAKILIENILKKYKEFPIVKSKSMVSEEVNLRDFLEKNGFEIYETDLGELIVQWEGKPPSHITAPAIHLSRFEVAKIFEEKLKIKVEEEPEKITKIAREFLREKFLKAKASIVGANFIVAEEGILVLLENEGNIRFCLELPQEVIILTGYEKVIPEIDNLKYLLKLLPPSATGQSQNAYTSFINLSKKHHLIVLKSFRERILKEEKEILYCIRCGACINVCPVFTIIGGHSYSSVYPGPIGIVLSFYQKKENLSMEILNLCSLCLACTEICPVKIPLHKIILKERGKVKKNFFEFLFSKILKLFSKSFFFNFSFKIYNLFPKFLKDLFQKNWKKGRETLKIKKLDFFKIWKKKD